MYKLSRLKRIAADLRDQGAAAIRYINDNPILSKYFPLLSKDITAIYKNRNTKFEPKNNINGRLLSDMKILLELVNKYQRSGIEPDNKIVAEDYSDYISNKKAPQTILADRAKTNEAITNEDIEYAEKYLAKYTIIPKYFSRILELIKSNDFKTSNLSKDLDNLLELSRALNKKAINATAAGAERLRQIADKYMELLEEGATVVDLQQVYNDNPPDIEMKRSAPNPYQTYSVPTTRQQDSKRTMKPGKNPRKDRMTPQAENVILRIKSIIEGNQPKDGPLARDTRITAADIKYVYQLDHEFEAYIKQTIAQGFLIYNPGELEREIISIIRFSKKVCEIGADKNEYLASQIQDLFEKWKRGIRFSRLKLSSKEMNRVVEYAAKVAAVVKQGEEAWYGNDVETMLLTYGFKFPKNSHEYNEFYDTVQWFIDYKNTIENIQRRDDPSGKVGLSDNNAIIEEYNKLHTRWENILNYLADMYEKLVEKDGRSKLYIDKSADYWQKNIQVIRAYRTGKLKLKYITNIQSMKQINTGTEDTFNIKPATWATLNDTQKKFIKGLVNYLGPGIIGNDGTVNSLAVSAVLITKGYTSAKGYTIKPLQEEQTKFEQELDKYLKKNDVEEMMKFRKEYLNRLLDAYYRVILDNMDLIKSKLPASAIHALDTDRSTSLTWLSQFKGRLDININDLVTNRSNIIYPIHLCKALYNAALVSLGERVRITPDHTTESFIRKVKQALRNAQVAQNQGTPEANPSKAPSQTNIMNQNPQFGGTGDLSVDKNNAIGKQVYPGTTASLTSTFRRLAKNLA